MTTYISLLRGINIGGHKKIKMDALRQMYSDLGFLKVQSYIQSGNVIFQSAETDTSLLEKSISNRILETFGFEVPALILTINELSTALKNSLFINNPNKDPTRMHLTFLSKIPDKSALDKISPAYYAPDEFCVNGKIIYNYCPNGYGNTKLTSNFFESKLKVIASSRNLKTSIELLDIATKV
ncbi:MAG TPA: DUF1697 domain-containing protein [Paludibacter sp.]|nr:DUF1697 domain-containing protein [Paludibacter sp.]